LQVTGLFMMLPPAVTLQGAPSTVVPPNASTVR
jgi:hypothetical protein